MSIVGFSGLTINILQGIPDRKSMALYAQIGESLESPPASNDAACKYAPDAPFNDNNSYCLFFDVGGSETIGILGDSHGAAAFSGMANVNKQLNLNTFMIGHIGNQVSSGQMPPLIGCDTQTFTPEQLNLNRIGEKQVEIILKRTDIRKVFIICRGTAYFTGNEPANPSIDWPHLTKENFAQALQKTVDRLNSAGKKVFILAENPELPFQPRDFIQRPFFNKPKPLLLKSDVLERQNDYLTILDNITGANIIHVIDKFCPTNNCLTFSLDGFIPLYRDDDHLGKAGSAFQAEYILKPLLEDTPQKISSSDE